MLACVLLHYSNRAACCCEPIKQTATVAVQFSSQIHFVLERNCTCNLADLIAQYTGVGELVYHHKRRNSPPDLQPAHKKILKRQKKMILKSKFKIHKSLRYASQRIRQTHFAASVFRFIASSFILPFFSDFLFFFLLNKNFAECQMKCLVEFRSPNKSEHRERKTEKDIDDQTRDESFQFFFLTHNQYNADTMRWSISAVMIDIEVYNETANGKRQVFGVCTTQTVRYAAGTCVSVYD